MVYEQRLNIGRPCKLTSIDIGIFESFRCFLVYRLKYWCWSVTNNEDTMMVSNENTQTIAWLKQGSVDTCCRYHKHHN